MSQPVKLIYGAFDLPTLPKEDASSILDNLARHGITTLDTAAIYPGSEEQLGASGASSKFAIHTKPPGFMPGCGKKESILAGMASSLTQLKLNQVDTYWLHSPDPTTPIEETLEAIQELYKAGKFRKFGISNFTAADVQKIYDYTTKRGYVQPSCFQGNYNAVTRWAEEDHLPLLRKLNIAFIAYSPIAGGFLAKSANEVTEGVGRFDKSRHIGIVYDMMYNKPALLESLTTWEAISVDSGISKAGLAYRWVCYHSALNGADGDGIVIGARSKEQVEEALQEIEKGPLPENVVGRISALWETVKHEAPSAHFVLPKQ